MKLVRLPLVIAGILLSCVMAPALPALPTCSTPPTLSKTYTWPAWTAGTNDVNIIPNNVPNGSVSTVISNWNNGLLAFCYPPYLQESPVGATGQITMHYASIPPPSNCPSGSTCYTRGITDLPNATFTSGHRLAGVTITINSSVTAAAAITEVVAHEFGHTFGLLDCNYPGCPTGSSVMEAGAPATSINGIIGQPGPTSCDINAVGSVAPDYACQPPPPSPPPCDPSCCNPCVAKQLGSAPGFVVRASDRKPGLQLVQSTKCCNSSPILIDISGQGFSLTSPEGGVVFDIAGTGNPIQLAWTAANANNAFLALPGADGLVHSGKQLFGNFTPQPAIAIPNGFAALAVYDDPKNGGNGDGVIDSRDAIFSSLRLWIDRNHDGISQPDELFTLPSLGVNSISLSYKADLRVDRYGNLFRYRAQVNRGNPANVGRMAYDVFFSTLTTPGSSVLTAATCANPETKEGLLDKK